MAFSKLLKFGSSGQSRIYTTDFHGNMTHSFGRVGRNGGEFNEPSGITCDSSGMLLIADSRNDRIEVSIPIAIILLLCKGISLVISIHTNYYVLVIY